MARRRLTLVEPPPTDGPVPPPELATCFVEDWLPDDWTPKPWQSDEHLDPLIAARRHHRDARTAWGHEHGLTAAELSALIPTTRPIWRNPPTAPPSRRSYRR